MVACEPHSLLANLEKAKFRIERAQEKVERAQDELHLAKDTQIRGREPGAEAARTDVSGPNGDATSTRRSGGAEHRQDSVGRRPGAHCFFFDGSLLLQRSGAFFWFEPR